MLPDFPDEPTEEERLRQSLFIELLHLAPEGAALYITNDSWEGLPALLGNRMRVVVENPYREWGVALTPENWVFLAQHTPHYELHVQFVHFAIEVNQRDLFVSYDRMVSIELDLAFPSTNNW